MDVSQAPVWIQAVVLGLVQGLCEFLPISSSGHLILVPELTHWKYLGKDGAGSLSASLDAGLAVGPGVWGGEGPPHAHRTRGFWQKLAAL